jgi:hypothetical protein
MIADGYPPLAPHRARPVLEAEEWLFESATEFIEALEKYYAEGATLEVFCVAACTERNLCEDPTLLKPCILCSRRRVG